MLVGLLVEMTVGLSDWRSAKQLELLLVSMLEGKLELRLVKWLEQEMVDNLAVQ